MFLAAVIVAEIGVRDLTNVGPYVERRTFRSFKALIALASIHMGLALA